jgi:hypothetical protein
MSLAISRLWNPLFRIDNLVLHLEVLQSFKSFVRSSTLASNGVNIVEQSVPSECKAEFSQMLCSQPDHHTADVAHCSVWNTLYHGNCSTHGLDKEANGMSDAVSASRHAEARYRLLGASNVSQDVSATHQGGGGKTSAGWKLVERDCSALELVLPRVEAAVRQERPSPQLRSRLLEITSSLERMRSLLT